MFGRPTILGLREVPFLPVLLRIIEASVLSFCTLLHSLVTRRFVLFSEMLIVVLTHEDGTVGRAKQIVSVRVGVNRSPRGVCPTVESVRD
jgi:hypothetical protein